MAGLSFLFFLAMMIASYARGHFGYFMLSTAFLIVLAFTMAGWWMQRRNVVEVFDGGLVFRKFTARWDEITAVERDPDGPLRLTKNGRDSAAIPRTLHAIGTLEAHIRERCGR